MTEVKAPPIDADRVIVLAPAIIALLVGIAVGAAFIWFFTEEVTHTEDIV